MQEVTTTSSTGASSLPTSFDQLRTSALVDVSSSTRAFSDFMNLAGGQGYGSSPTGGGLSRYMDAAQSSGSDAIQSATSAAQTTGAAASTAGSGAQNLFAAKSDTQIKSDAQNIPAAQPVVQSDTASTLATTVSTGKKNNSQTSTGSSTGANAAAATAQALTQARNTTVSRESFEEAKPLLIKSGFTENEISDLSARVQAGSLTWGQMVQAMAAHTAGAKKSVQLSDGEKANLQSMFQKLGFDSQTSTDMAGAMADGDGLKVLSAIQNKLQSTPDSSSVGVNQDELAAFFKALRAPSDTAQALTQKLATGNATAADMKSALSVLGQALTQQRTEQVAQDTATAKSMAKIMQKDVAKNARDTTGTTSATGSSDPQVAFSLKTKDPNDTSWFGDHEKNQRQQASDDAWKSFTSKVRQDDSGAQHGSSQSASGQTAAGLASSGQAAKADASGLGSTAAGLTGMTQQQTAAGATQAKPFDKVLAPKVLDQVSEAMLKDLGQGRKQLTMELDPDNLGKVQVMLQVKGKEVTAVIHAEDSGTAAMLHANMEGLRKSLEEKGLTVQHMEVQTGLAGRQDQQQASFNAEQHNQAQQEQQQGMSRVLSQLRMVRSDDGVALDMQNMSVQAILADQGLHLIA